MVEEIVSHVCRQFSLREGLLSRPGERSKSDEGSCHGRVVGTRIRSFNPCGTERSVSPGSLDIEHGGKGAGQEAQTDRDLNRLKNKIREDLFEIQISKA